jgi:hypothetical protein
VHVGCWMPYESLSEPWTTHLSLTERCAITQAKAHITLFCLYPGFGMHHSPDKHLACGDGTNLDCSEVMAIIVDYGMTIITLDSLYSMLSYRPTPPDALSMQYG